ncbi:hypothetical protein [Mesorhizobium shangrilense]|uniref:Uncharacterized protein n=1 Tax=Mesorhizobium shangrilense TaxID=460060 RepID=A0ABV2DH37_9HYPH
MSETRIDGLDDVSVWDGADPDLVAQKAIELYGADALTAAAHCGLSANFDGRERDFRFWVKVFRLLGSGQPALRPPQQTYLAAIAEPLF